MNRPRQFDRGLFFSLAAPLFIRALLHQSIRLATRWQRDLCFSGKRPFFDFINWHDDRRRELIRQRIEKAYAPLDYWLYKFNTAGEKSTTASLSQIQEILRQYGYLLNPVVRSGLYVLVEEAKPTESSATEITLFMQDYHRILK